MSNHPEHDRPFCIDRVVSLAFEREARAIAIAENPDNAPSPEANTSERLALVKTKRWRPGRTLRCRFLAGAADTQRKVQQYAAQWTRYANLHFEFGNDPRAEVRIAFAPGSSWSACGTDCLVQGDYPLYQPTMNLGNIDGNTKEEEFAFAVLHEFGHAIGCIHEHQNPVGGMQWDERAVIHYFSGEPSYWSEAQIRAYVIDKYSESQLNGTAFDPESIMLYDFPRSLTKNGMSTQRHSRLSTTDISFIKRVYP